MVQYRLRTFHSPTTLFNSGPTEVFVTGANRRIDLKRVQE